MTGPLGAYGVDDAREIHRRVLGQRYSQPPLDRARNQTIHNMLYYVLLTEDLATATDTLTGYTQASGRVLRYVQPMDPLTLNMEESQSAEGLVTVTNRYTTFSALAGDLLLIIRNGSEWSPVNVAGSSGSQRHAKITGCLGNGYYSAELVDDPSFLLPSLTGTGTATGTGSGQYDECDPCQWVQGENEAGTGTAYVAAACGSLSQPSRVGVTGGGTTIYCYDPRKLTLQSDAHIIVSDLGDTITSPETGTGTGTGTAEQSESLWMILTGNYELIGIPDRWYACCDGNVTMVKCDTYIVEGFFCPGVETGCPGTGTA